MMFKSLMLPSLLPPMERLIEVEILESAMQEILATIGSHPPETVGMLAGNLDHPNRILEFRFCPPSRKADGKYDRSYGHINVDAEYMNFVIDEEWRPRGLDLLGIGHSHPEGCFQLSYGDELSNEGDVVFFRNCLRNDDSPGHRWKVCYAPIITFESPAEPRVHWYAVTLDSPVPIPVIARIISDSNGPSVLETPATSIQDETGVSRLPIDEWMELGSHYQGLVNDVLADRVSPDEHRQWMANFIHQTMKEDLTRRFKATFK